MILLIFTMVLILTDNIDSFEMVYFLAAVVDIIMVVGLTCVIIALLEKIKR